MEGTHRPTADARLRGLQTIDMRLRGVLSELISIESRAVDLKLRPECIGNIADKVESLIGEFAGVIERERQTKAVRASETVDYGPPSMVIDLPQPTDRLTEAELRTDAIRQGLRDAGGADLDGAPALAHDAEGVLRPYGGPTAVNLPLCSDCKKNPVYVQADGTRLRTCLMCTVF